MNAGALWERYCHFFRAYETVGISLDVSRMRFSDSFLASLGPNFTEAFRAMEALERGSIANPDEQRKVGHYWLRTPELAPDQETASTVRETTRKILSFASGVHQGSIMSPSGKRFRNVVVIGIGGSALGPQLLADALGTNNDPMRMFFCDNTDPDGIARLLGQLTGKLDETMCLVISKSGGTIETRNGALEFAAAYTRAGLSFPKHVVAITCPGSKLDAQATAEGWLERFPLWDWVGGRTSLFSAVGLLPAALQGLAVEEFVAGGKAMDAITRTPNVTENPAALLAAMWYFAGGGQGKKDMVILPYKDRLALFSKYLQQLVMESLGKERDLKGQVVNQGIAVYGNKGSTDQHAYVQQLRDGLNNFFATFIQVKEDVPKKSSTPIIEVEPGVTSGNYLHGFFLGTRRALFENNRDSITIVMDHLTAHSLGALIAMYDRTVGLYASLIGINAYHQPGVEAGKKAAAQVIALQHQIVAALNKSPSKAFTAVELSHAIGGEDDTETIFQICDYLSASLAGGVDRVSGSTPADMHFRIRGA